MLKYNLFGQTVIFEDAAERYFDLQFAAEQAGLNVSQRFQEWYKQCGNIQSVLDGYLQFSESAIERLAFLPLYGQLTGCEIYDISEESYWKRCIGFGESESALETVERQYNAILKRQNAKRSTAPIEKLATAITYPIPAFIVTIGYGIRQRLE